MALVLVLVLLVGVVVVKAVFSQAQPEYPREGRWQGGNWQMDNRRTDSRHLANWQVRNSDQYVGRSMSRLVKTLALVNLLALVTLCLYLGMTLSAPVR